MNQLDVLKSIVTNQKSVSTKRLAPLVDKVTEMYVQSGNKISRQKSALSEKDETIKKLKKLNEQLAMKYGAHLMYEEDKKRLRKGVRH